MRILNDWLCLGLCILLLGACKKEQVITSPDALLATSTEKLFFDTVFTARGSVTQYFTIINPNQQKLTLASLQLEGGNNSPFQMNVNGDQGANFTNLTLDAGDSLYVFVRITIDPNNATLPFLVRDSISVRFNGNTRKIMLEAFGQNAQYITNGNISSNTIWTAGLPYVIVNPITVDPGVTLTLQEGTRIYFSAQTPLLVNGTLLALGDKYDSTRVILRGDRLDAQFSDLPGGWPGILFGPTSTGNLLRYANILNAYQAVVAIGSPSQSPAKLQLQQCIIDNAYDIGLLAFNSSVKASNCLISQVGNNGEPGTGGSNVILTAGGNYQFDHCTLVTYGNYYQNHKQGVLFLSNSSGGQQAALDATFTNCILFGEGGLAEDEIKAVNVSGAPFNVSMRNVLYRAQNDPQGISFSNSLRNADPVFDSVNTSLRKYNFRLRDNSPAVDKGASTSLLVDLDGRPRVAGAAPDLGCYERQ